MTLPPDLMRAVWDIVENDPLYANTDEFIIEAVRLRVQALRPTYTRHRRIWWWKALCGSEERKNAIRLKAGTPIGTVFAADDEDPDCKACLRLIAEGKHIGQRRHPWPGEPDEPDIEWKWE